MLLMTKLQYQDIEDENLEKLLLEDAPQTNISDVLLAIKIHPSLD